jgi:RimJ/RimL family protein N-acetyltransferase
MQVIIETERLLLREFTLDDAELVYTLNSDPEVTRYTGDPIRDIAQAREVIEQKLIPQYVLQKMGRFAVLVKPTHEFIGWCGLKFRPERNEIDLGYRFMRSAWGKGYATEAARACLDHGFQTLEVRRVVGHSMPDNIASIRVLENCGMRFVCEEIIDNHPARTYEALNPFIQ